MALNHITNSTGTILNRYTVTHADSTTEDVRLTFNPSSDYVAGSPFNENIMNPIIDEINGKQAALVSGTNIKTIDGNSLLGSGDLSIGIQYDVIGTL